LEKERQRKEIDTKAANIRERDRERERGREREIGKKMGVKCR